jgi:hypothetical protein
VADEHFARPVLWLAAALVVALGSAIANFAWLPYQPIWSSIMIAVCISVIWALTTHGRDAA